MTKILRAVGATFVHKMRGTSRPHAKFTGDFGNAIEVIRISDRSLLSVFAKNLEPCNFRLLQHYLGHSGLDLLTLSSSRFDPTQIFGRDRSRLPIRSQFPTSPTLPWAAKEKSAYEPNQDTYPKHVARRI